MPPPCELVPFNFTDIPFNCQTASSVYWVNSELVITILLILMMCQLFQTPILFMILLKLRR